MALSADGKLVLNFQRVKLDEWEKHGQFVGFMSIVDVNSNAPFDVFRKGRYKWNVYKLFSSVKVAIHSFKNLNDRNSLFSISKVCCFHSNRISCDRDREVGRSAGFVGCIAYIPKQRGDRDELLQCSLESCYRWYNIPCAFCSIVINMCFGL